MVLTGNIYAEKLADLDVLQPRSIAIEGDRLYITTRSTIYLYSTKNFKQISTFGKRGEGPGEFKWIPRLRVGPDILVMEDIGKIMLFSVDGVFQKDIKHPGQVKDVYPIGKQFTGVQDHINNETQKTRRLFNLYDGELNVITTYYKGEEEDLPNYRAAKMKYLAVQHYRTPTVSNHRIYLPDTSKGFFIAVFDDAGKKLYDIKKESPKKKITKKFKSDFMDALKAGPNWERTKDKVEVVFPEFYPAFNDMTVNGGKLYVYPFQEQKKKTVDLLVLDLKGKLLKKTRVPNQPHGAIAGETFYYLVENETKEQWELHAVEI